LVTVGAIRGCIIFVVIAAGAFLVLAVPLCAAHWAVPVVRSIIPRWGSELPAIIACRQSISHYSVPFQHIANKLVVITWVIFKNVVTLGAPDLFPEMEFV
jgi:hypothetical protein